MKVLVTGSVSWTDPAPVEAALDGYLAEHPHLLVLTGMADGVDTIARSWARRHNVAFLAEPLDAGEYPGPMHRYNRRMLGWAPDVVVACKPDLDLEQNPQAGTEHMCLIASAAGIPVRHLEVGDELSQR